MTERMKKINFISTCAPEKVGNAAWNSVSASEAEVKGAGARGVDGYGLYRWAARLGILILGVVCGGVGVFVETPGDKAACAACKFACACCNSSNAELAADCVSSDILKKIHIFLYILGIMYKNTVK